MITHSDHRPFTAHFHLKWRLKCSKQLHDKDHKVPASITQLAVFCTSVHLESQRIRIRPLFSIRRQVRHTCRFRSLSLTKKSRYRLRALFFIENSLSYTSRFLKLTYNSTESHDCCTKAILISSNYPESATCGAISGPRAPRTTKS